MSYLMIRLFMYLPKIVIYVADYKLLIAVSLYNENFNQYY